MRKTRDDNGGLAAMFQLRRWWGRVLLAGIAGTALTLVVACGTQGTPEAAGSGSEFFPAASAASVSGDNHPIPSTSPPPDSAVLKTTGFRQSPGVVTAADLDSPYNYAPTVLESNGQYRMWWCSQLPTARPGDQILSAQAGTLNGPFNAAPGTSLVVFSNSAAGFDALHTCDPSVIMVNGVYYLYYTGTAVSTGQDNAIGLATSTDGIHWVRAAGGQPIVSPAGEVLRSNEYGVGQPSALYLNGWFYLLFTDTTAAAAGPNGEGQFVLRSHDPAFSSGVQALGPNGFVSVPNTHSSRMRSVYNGFSTDWMWVDALNAFAIAADTGSGTTITFWDADFTSHPYQSVAINGSWQEGPGLVRQADGHAPILPSGPCNQIPIDVFRATSLGAGPTNIMHFGLNVIGPQSCPATQQTQNMSSEFAGSTDNTVEPATVGKQAAVTGNNTNWLHP